MPDLVKFRSEIAALVDKEGRAQLVRTRHNAMDKTYEFVFLPHKGSFASLDTTMQACAVMVNRVHGPGVVMPRADRELTGHFALVAQASWFSSQARSPVTDVVFVLLFPVLAVALSGFFHAIVPA